MLGKTHLAFGALTGLGAHSIMNSQGMDANLLIIPASMLGSLIPDIDKANTKLGRKVKPLSYTLEHTIGHRTLTHSFLFLFIISFIVLKCVEAFSLPISILYGISIGIISHFFTDFITKEGIPLLYPYKKKFAINLMKTGSFKERIFRYSCYISIAFLISKFI